METISLKPSIMLLVLLSMTVARESGFCRMDTGCDTDSEHRVFRYGGRYNGQCSTEDHASPSTEGVCSSDGIPRASRVSGIVAVGHAQSLDRLPSNLICTAREPRCHYRNGVRRCTHMRRALICKELIPPDVTRPTISLQSDITVNTLLANSSGLVLWNVTCDDNVDKDITPVCNATNGSYFNVGETAVSCVCTDKRGNKAATSFLVRVIETTRPIISVPLEVNVNTSSTNSSGFARWNVTCYDYVDTDLTPSCNKSSGSYFNVGVTVVSCECTDSEGNKAVSNFRVTVTDNTPPVISAPSDVIVNTSVSSSSAAASWDVTCNDNVDQDIMPVCNETNGSSFNAGVTAVSCTCTDDQGNNVTTSFSVIVTDYTPPVISAPHEVIVNTSLSNSSGIASWGVTCDDNVDQDLTPICNATSGSYFDVGETAVSCDCTDTRGNNVTATFSVIVIDMTVPILSTPPDFTVNMTSSGSVGRASWNATCADNVDGNIAPICSWQSGRDFKIGVTRVNCTCGDKAGNIAESSFIVTVTGYCSAVTANIQGGAVTFKEIEVGKTAESEENCFKTGNGVKLPRALRNCTLTPTGATWATVTINRCIESSDQNNGVTLIQAIGNVSDDNVGFVAADLRELTNKSSEEFEDGFIDDIASVLDRICSTNTTAPDVTRNFFGVVDNVVRILEEEEEKEEMLDERPGDERNTEHPESQADEVAIKRKEPIINIMDNLIHNLVKKGANLTEQTTDNLAVTFVQVTDVTSPVTFACFKEPEAINTGWAGGSLKDAELETVDRKLNNSEKINTLVSIEIPVEVFETQPTVGEDVTISFVIHRSDVLFVDESTEQSGREVVTPIIAATTAHEVRDLDNPVVIRFELEEVMTHPGDVDNDRTTLPSEDGAGPNTRYWFTKDCKVPLCVFWDKSLNNNSGGWSQEGIETKQKPLTNYTECLSSHLTNFAVLMDWKGDSLKRSLDILSIVGCGVSIGGLAVTILTFLTIKKLRNSRPQQIVLQMCFSLLGLYLTFMTGVERTGNRLLCNIVGSLIHFFCLASVFWMSAEATNLYLLLVKVFNADVHRFMFKASVVCWGLPGLIVITNSLASPASLSTCSYCFLEPDSYGFRYGLMAVLAVLVSYNMFLLVLIAWKLTCGRKRFANIKNSRQETIQRLQNVVAISVVLGVTWITGFFSISGARDAFNFMFCAFNSLQGFFVFLFFCFRQKEIQNTWKDSRLLMSLTTLRSKNKNSSTKSNSKDALMGESTGKFGSRSSESKANGSESHTWKLSHAEVASSIIDMEMSSISGDTSPRQQPADFISVASTFDNDTGAFQCVSVIDAPTRGRKVHPRMGYTVSEANNNVAVTSHYANDEETSLYANYIPKPLDATHVKTEPVLNKRRVRPVTSPNTVVVPCHYANVEETSPYANYISKPLNTTNVKPEPVPNKRRVRPVTTDSNNVGLPSCNPQERSSSARRRPLPTAGTDYRSQNALLQGISECPYEMFESKPTRGESVRRAAISRGHELATRLPRVSSNGTTFNVGTAGSPAAEHETDINGNRHSNAQGTEESQYDMFTSTPTRGESVRQATVFRK